VKKNKSERIELASYNSISEMFKGVNLEQAVKKAAHQYGVKTGDIYQQVFEDMFKVISLMNELSREND
jgi:hypothetical protein